MTKKKKHSLVQSCAIVALCAIAGPTFAQTTPAAPTAAAKPSGEADTVVIITGTPTVGGVKKMDAAFSVVSLTQEQLKQSGLTSSADVLKSSPGLFIESSGGPGAGANVEIIGFPSNSLAPYATFELNGTSFFPQAGQTYLDGDLFLRNDDTVQRVELVQGGPAVLYGDGQPGLTANYILKRGTDTPSGSLGVTYGSENYYRLDGFLSGPVIKSAGINGTIGGYWNKGDGIRNPQFTADKGGQLTATLSKKWDTGSLMVYGRYIDLDDEFVTDTPITLNSDGSFSPYPGFSPLTGTMSSKADQHLDYPIGPCTGTGCTPSTIALNQEDGRGMKGGVVGGEFHWNFGNGVQLLDNFSYSSGTAHMSALYSSAIAPESLQAFVTAGETKNHLTGITGVNSYYTTDGSTVPLTENVMEAEVRDARETYHAGSNEIHLSWQPFDGNTLTIGNRTVYYGVNVLVYQGANILLQAQNNPTPIGINLTNGTNTWQLTSPEGFINGPGSSSNNTFGTGVNTAFFLSDSWKWNKFLLDAGVRMERQIFDAYLENSATTNLTGNANNLWGTGKYFLPGSTEYKYDRTATSWTVGLNYEFTSNFSAYGRVNKGIHFLSFGDLVALPLGNAGPTQVAYNYQSGVKFRNSYIYADVSAFYRTFRNVAQPISSVPIPGTTTTGTATLVYGSDTRGLEYNFVLTPFKGKGRLDGFTLSATGDWALGKYTQTNGCVFFSGAGVTPFNYCQPSYSYNGNWLARQPNIQTRITPAYKTDTSWGTLRVWANWEYVGKRFSDMFEAQRLPIYSDWSAGVSGEVGQNWEWTLSGTNLTNAIGLTEENPRGTLAGGIPAPGTQLVRSIDGREVSFQVKYHY